MRWAWCRRGEVAEVSFDPDQGQIDFHAGFYRGAISTWSPPTGYAAKVGGVADFGGFINRNGDDMPGPKTIWIGLRRCKDFVLAIKAQNIAQRGGCG